MNVWLDGSWLAPGIGGTGVRRFSAELSAAMLGRLGDGGHVFSIGQPVAPAFRRPGVRYAVVPAAYRLHLWATALFGAPDVARRLEPAPDVIHWHDAVRFPGGPGPRAVVTVHDLAALREPATYPARAAWLRRRALERLRRSDAVVHAVSEATRADVIELGGIPPERVEAVPEGVSPAFFTAVPRARRAAVQARLGLERPFLVAVGAQHPRKNLGFLVGAFRDLLRARGHDVLLALIGPGGSGHVDALCRQAGYRADERACVRVLGALPDDDLRACLQASVALVYPSLYEGFGLPVLEAMASGTAVVASHRSSLPEVVGDSGILLDPRDRAGWVEAMAHLLHAPGDAAALGARGQARARRFTWAAAAERLLGLMGVTAS